MKKIKLIIGAALALAALTVTVPAQTNPPDIYDNIGGILGNLGLSSNPTNYAIGIGGSRSVKNEQWAAWLLAVENVNNNVGVCAGVDHLWGGGNPGSANVVAGGITLKAPCHPLKFLSADTNSWEQKFTLSPIAVAMVGTPINGTGNADGGLASIVRGGANIDVVNYKGWEFGVSATYGKRSGAGNYNGDWIDVGFNVRKGF